MCHYHWKRRRVPLSLEEEKNRDQNCCFLQQHSILRRGPYKKESSWNSSQWAGSNFLDRIVRGLYFLNIILATVSDNSIHYQVIHYEKEPKLCPKTGGVGVKPNSNLQSGQLQLQWEMESNAYPLLLRYPWSPFDTTWIFQLFSVWNLIWKEFLATLVALHLTPVSERISE